MPLPARDKNKIAVVGLGNVGLPLAVDLARQFSVLGFDGDNAPPRGPFDAIVPAVRHDEISRMGEGAQRSLLAPNGPIYDNNGILPAGVSHAWLWAARGRE